MKDKYMAEVNIYQKLPDGSYSKDSSYGLVTYGNDLSKLKDEVSDKIIRFTMNRDCCVTILFEKNNEYYDSEEIFLEKGEIV